MTRACSARGSTITISRRSKSTLHSRLVSRNSAARGFLPWRPQAATATATLSTGPAMCFCLGRKLAASRNPCWIGRDGNLPCSFPCGRLAAASIYPMQWQSSLMKPGVSWAVPGRTHNAGNHDRRGRAARLQDEGAFEYGDAAPADVRFDCLALPHHGAPEQQTGPPHIDALMNAPSTLGMGTALGRRTVLECPWLACAGVECREQRDGCG